MEKERWHNFSKHDQLMFLSSEFERANVWQREDEKKFCGALERALEIIDILIDDPKWKDGRRMLLGLREKTASFYAGMEKGSVEILNNIL